MEDTTTITKTANMVTKWREQMKVRKTLSLMLEHAKILAVRKKLIISAPITNLQPAVQDLIQAMTSG